MCRRWTGTRGCGGLSRLFKTKLLFDLPPLQVLDRKDQEKETLLLSREEGERSRAESEKSRERLKVLEEELRKMRKKVKDHQKLVWCRRSCVFVQTEAAIARQRSEIQDVASVQNFGKIMFKHAFPCFPGEL